ncbi:MAG: 50S ribosomal protein L21 [Alphaproteobacteria bacterium]|nr:50S ribosomal protein L21 [Alphaproteobacteria bacterium]
MFAVIKTGGKQYKVAKDDIFSVEKIDGEVGSDVVFDEVLMVDDKIGAPRLKGAKVTAEVINQTRDDKIIIFKKNRRKGYRRKQGHRQYITVVKIKDIVAA